MLGDVLTDIHLVSRGTQVWTFCPKANTHFTEYFMTYIPGNHY